MKYQTETVFFLKNSNQIRLLSILRFFDEFISKMPKYPKRSSQLSEALRRPLAYLGIYRSGAFEDDSISLRSYVIMVLMSSYLVLSVAFMALKSKTFQSHADCFWITATNMLMFCVVVLLALKRRNLFELIDNFENIIENRKKTEFIEKPQGILS